MPTYSYQCQECGHTMDALQKITDKPLEECPQCRRPSLRRGVGGGIGLSFQGSGFYITDYAKNSGSCSKQEACPCSSSGE